MKTKREEVKSGDLSCLEKGFASCEALNLEAQRFNVLQAIFFPNGVRAREAILKCWRPKGMPIIVRQSRRPKPRCVRQIQKPPTQIQRTFITSERHPPPFPLSVTVRPKGQRARIQSFNVCNPNGMPIIVIIKTKLATRYSAAVSNPPKSNQMIFPNVFINRCI